MTAKLKAAALLLLLGGCVQAPPPPPYSAAVWRGYGWEPAYSYQRPYYSMDAPASYAPPRAYTYRAALAAALCAVMARGSRNNCTGAAAENRTRSAVGVVVFVVEFFFAVLWR